MNIFLAMLAAQAGAPETTPHITSLQVLPLQAGACGPVSANPAASIRVIWSASGFDSSMHQYKVYEDSVLKATVTSASPYVKVITGNIEDGPVAQFTSGWVYRVDLVRAIDGAVLSSATTDPWVRVYGRCPVVEPE